MAINQGLVDAADNTNRVVSQRNTANGEALVKPRSVEDFLEEQNLLLRRLIRIVSLAWEVDDPEEEEEILEP